MPNPPAVTPGADILASWGNDVINRVVPIFPDVATRDAAMPSPETGQLSLTVAPVPSLRIWINDYWHVVMEWSNVDVSTNPARRAQFGVAAGGIVRAHVDEIHINKKLRSDAGAELSGNLQLVDEDGIGIRILKVGAPNVVNIHNNAGMCALPEIWKHDTTSAANVTVTGASGNMMRSTSSRKAKTDIARFAGDPGTVIDQLEPVTFRSTLQGDDPDETFLGFITEDVAKALPPAAADDGHNYDVRSLVAVLVAEVQKLRGRVAALEGSA